MPNALRLAPDHLAYLRARGITDETIAANGLCSARPQDLPRLAGRPVPEGTSGLVLPYEGCDGFARVRLFPPIKNQDGREQKFGQPAGSPVRLYVPAGVREVLADPEQTVIITEGEGKALALTQAGFPAVAISGIWIFARKTEGGRRELIPDLGAIPWTGRIARIVPDSDVWDPTREDLLLAVYTLARLLQDAGATVSVVKLPACPGQGKTGADDFLVAKGPSEFAKLVTRAAPLGAAVFRPFRERERAERRRAEASRPAASVEEILARGEARPALRQGQGFASGVLVYGVSLGGERLFVTGEREALNEPQARERFTMAEAEANLPGHWRPASIRAYLAGAPVSLGDVFARVEDRLRRHVAWRKRHHAVAVALWVLATYWHALFGWFGFLWLNSPRPRCGKTRVLEIVEALAFHATPILEGPSPPFLYREVADGCPTVILDELEGLAGKDRETYQAVISLLNHSARNGGRVPRMEKAADGTWRARYFDAFGPKALAGISRLPATIGDRAFRLVLWRKRKADCIEGFSTRKLSPALAALRDDLYGVGLTYARDIAAFYDHADQLPIPDGLDDRARDIFESLFAVAAAVDADRNDSGGSVTAALTAFAREQTGLRADAEETDGRQTAVIRTLCALPVSAGEPYFLTPEEAFTRLVDALGPEVVKSKAKAGRLLGELGLVSGSHRVGCGVVRSYRLDAELLADLRERFYPLELAGPVEGSTTGLPEDSLEPVHSPEGAENSVTSLQPAPALGIP